jgi:hypothetical protein
MNINNNNNNNNSNIDNEKLLVLQEINEKRLICSEILDKNDEDCCEILTNLLFQNDMYIWSMYHWWIRKEIEENGVGNNITNTFCIIFNKILTMRFYLNIKAFKNYKTEKWELFIYPFSTDYNIYVYIQDLDIYCIQSIQKLLMNDAFTQLDKDIYGFQLLYNNFKYNLYCNKFIKHKFVITSICKTIFKLSNGIKEFISYYNNNIEQQQQEEDNSCAIVNVNNFKESIKNTLKHVISKSECSIMFSEDEIEEIFVDQVNK